MISEIVSIETYFKSTSRARVGESIFLYPENRFLYMYFKHALNGRIFLLLSEQELFYTQISLEYLK